MSEISRAIVARRTEPDRDDIRSECFCLRVTQQCQALDGPFRTGCTRRLRRRDRSDVALSSCCIASPQQRRARLAGTLDVAPPRADGDGTSTRGRVARGRAALATHSLDRARRRSDPLDRSTPADGATSPRSIRARTLTGKRPLPAISGEQSAPTAGFLRKPRGVRCSRSRLVFRDARAAVAC